MRANSAVKRVELLPESTMKDLLLPSVESSTTKNTTRPPTEMVSMGSAADSAPFHAMTGGDHIRLSSPFSVDARDARTTPRAPARTQPDQNLRCLTVTPLFMSWLRESMPIERCFST